MTTKHAAKRLSRIFHWQNIFDQLGRSFKTRRYLVLANDGTDLGILTGYGVPEGNITAIDEDSGRAFDCLERFPKVNVLCGNLAELIKEQKRSIDCASLDFGRPVDEASMELLRTAVHHAVKTDGVLGVIASSRVADNPACRQLWEEIASLETLFGEDVKDYTPASMWVMGFSRMLGGGFTSLVVPWMIPGFFYYKDEGGFPHVFVCHRVLRALPGMSPKRFASTLYNRPDYGMYPAGKQIIATDADLKSIVMEKLGILGFDDSFIQALALVYGVPEATLTEWLHERNNPITR